MIYHAIRQKNEPDVPEEVQLVALDSDDPISAVVVAVGILRVDIAGLPEPCEDIEASVRFVGMVVE